MRIAVLLVAATALAASACRTHPERSARALGVPAEAFAPLREDDVARFTRVLRPVIVIAHKRGAQGGDVRVRDDAGAIFARRIEWVGGVPGIDSVLAAGGVDWPFFRAMLYRIDVCAQAVASDRQGRDERLERAIKAEPSEAMAVALRAREAELRRVAKAVPKANIEMYRRHYRDLNRVYYLMAAR